MLIVKQGAYALGQWIEEKYGKDSISMLVDEGSGISESWGEVRQTAIDVVLILTMM